jgi:hypothetical protein
MAISLQWMFEYIVQGMEATTMYDWKKVTEGTWVVEETKHLEGLTLGTDARIQPPEGKQLTMTVDGIQKDIKPGQYQGDIVLTVSDVLIVPYREMNHPFSAALLIEDGKVSDKSVQAAIQNGTYQDGLAENLKIETQGDLFNGVYITGGGEYTIRNARIRAEGTGGNDFCGWGSAFTTHGSAKVLVENSTIETIGAAKNAVVVAGDSDVTFRNCEIQSKNGTLSPEYQDTIKLGVMKAVPWMLGLRGNCRATNLCKNGKVRYENCHIAAAGWGALSVDDLEKGSLVAKDCLIEVTGVSGYGSFSIGECTELFDHCTIRVPDYGLIGASGDQHYTNGTIIEAGKNSLTSSTKGTLTADKGCIFKSGMTTIANKGGACDFLLSDCTLTSGTGVIFQTTVSDDPRSPTGYYCDPTEDDVRDKKIDVCVYEKGDDTLLSMTDMTVTGDIYNSSTNAKADTGKPMMMPMMPMLDAPLDGNGKSPEMPPMMRGKQGARNLQVCLNNTTLTGRISASKAVHRVKKITKENCGELGIFVDTPQPAVNNGVIVYVESDSKWVVTGDSYLTKLVLAENATLCALAGQQVTLLVDGVETPVAAGTYQGAITLQVQ